MSTDPTSDHFYELALQVCFGSQPITPEQAANLDDVFVSQAEAVERLRPHCSNPEQILKELVEENWLEPAYQPIGEGGESC